MDLYSVTDAFCEAYGVDSREVFSASVGRRAAMVRYMTWYYLHYDRNWPASRISRMFSRNIPSVFRGIRIMREHMKFHKDIKASYDSVVRKIEGDG